MENISKQLSNFTYIYNIPQANFYIQNGVSLLEIGLHSTTHRVWFKFDFHESTSAYSEWCTRQF